MTLTAMEPGGTARRPLCVHPENPRYLLFRGRPTVLVTAGEHYGALINQEFDYRRYFDSLAAAGLNLTRVFSGSYVEGPRSLDFAGYGRNTLAPRPGKLGAPWARGDDGKFDLDRWDERYFERLGRLVGYASALGVVVDFVFFSQMYNAYTWGHSPLSGRNNVNGVGRCGWRAFTTMEEQGLVRRQESLVRKVMAELRGFDNLYYEICNEPEDTRLEVRAWVAHMARAIRLVNAGGPGPHLVAAAAGQGEQGLPAADILDFHYTWVEGAVGAIEALDLHGGAAKPLAFGESAGPLLQASVAQARVEAWEFLVGGGAVYNGLSWEYTVNQPAGAGRGHHALQKQMGVLRRFMDGIDFARMTPDRSAFSKGWPPGVTLRALARPGEDYVVYLHRGRRFGNPADTVYALPQDTTLTELSMRLPPGRYSCGWFRPETGGVIAAETIEHVGGERIIRSPEYREDVLLRVRRRDEE